MSGASKRGWGTLLTAAVEDCKSCVDIIGIFPLVPIVPPLIEEIHYQWESYGGFSWAFKDYMQADLLPHIDDPIIYNLSLIIDPRYYKESLSRMPKYMLVASDDEFMQYDWTALWFNKYMGGETHLNIAPNTEHT